MAKQNVDMAAVMRRRNLRTESQIRNRVEEAALEERMAETLVLGTMRGEALEQAPQKRGESRKPIRRMSGLEWLHGKKRIDDDQRAAGERYGAVYRRAKGDGAISSILNDERGGGRGVSLSIVMAHSEGTAQAASKLAMYRRQLSGQTGMIRACDIICGEELTPREASTDGHEAGKLEAVLVVALCLLSEIARGGT